MKNKNFFVVLGLILLLNGASWAQSGSSKKITRADLLGSQLLTQYHRLPLLLGQAGKLTNLLKLTQECLKQGCVNKKDAVTLSRHAKKLKSFLLAKKRLDECTKDLNSNEVRALKKTILLSAVNETTKPCTFDKSNKVASSLGPFKKQIEEIFDKDQKLLLLKRLRQETQRNAKRLEWLVQLAETGKTNCGSHRECLEFTAPLRHVFSDEYLGGRRGKPRDRLSLLANKINQDQKALHQYIDSYRSQMKQIAFRNLQKEIVANEDHMDKYGRAQKDHFARPVFQPQPYDLVNYHLAAYGTYSGPSVLMNLPYLRSNKPGPCQGAQTVRVSDMTTTIKRKDKKRLTWKWLASEAKLDDVQFDVDKRLDCKPPQINRNDLKAALADARKQIALQKQRSRNLKRSFHSFVKRSPAGHALPDPEMDTQILSTLLSAPLEMGQVLVNYPSSPTALDFLCRALEKMDQDEKLKTLVSNISAGVILTTFPLAWAGTLTAGSLAAAGAASVGRVQAVTQMAAMADLAATTVAATTNEISIRQREKLRQSLQGTPVDSILLAQHIHETYEQNAELRGTVGRAVTLTSVISNWAAVSTLAKSSLLAAFLNPTLTNTAGSLADLDTFEAVLRGTLTKGSEKSDKLSERLSYLAGSTTPQPYIFAGGRSVKVDFDQ